MPVETSLSKQRVRAGTAGLSGRDGQGGADAGDLTPATIRAYLTLIRSEIAEDTAFRAHKLTRTGVRVMLYFGSRVLTRGE